MSLTVEGFENMIAGSLGIEEPWYISKCTVDNATQTMHIYVSVRENAKICCPKCGGETKRYGYEKKERTWQHGNVCTVVARRCFARTAAHSRSALRLNGRTAGRHCCSRA